MLILDKRCASLHLWDIHCMLGNSLLCWRDYFIVGMQTINSSRAVIMEEILPQPFNEALFTGAIAHISIINNGNTFISNTFFWASFLHKSFLEYYRNKLNIEYFEISNNQMKSKYPFKNKRNAVEFEKIEQKQKQKLSTIKQTQQPFIMTIASNSRHKMLEVSFVSIWCERQKKRQRSLIAVYHCHLRNAIDLFINRPLAHVTQCLYFWLQFQQHQITSSYILFLILSLYLIQFVFVHFYEDLKLRFHVFSIFFLSINQRTVDRRWNFLVNFLIFSYQDSLIP